jgi:hypothetical protein
MGLGRLIAVRRRERDLLWLGVGGAILMFVMLAMPWVFRVSVYQPPDEASHVAYARELSHGRLPTIDSPIPGDDDARLAAVLRDRDARHRTIWTANHPPLYYALVAVPLRIGTDTGQPIRGVLAARLLSVGLSALGLIALAYVVLQLAPSRPQLAVAATGFVALLPTFIAISARVYNDSLAFLTTTATLAAAAAFVIRGPSAARLAAVAATAGFAAMTRASGLLVVGVAELAVLVGVLRAGESSAWRRLWRAAVWMAMAGAVVVAVAGWFYLRNLTLYGDLTGSAALLHRFGRPPNNTMLGLLTDQGYWRLQQRRLWDVTNFLPRVHGGLVARLWLLGLVPLAGLLLAGARGLARLARGDGLPDAARAVALGLCVALLGLLQLSVVQFVSNGGGGHIRYLFPGLVTVGLVAAVGLVALPGGGRGVPVVAMTVVMGAINLWFWWPYREAIISDQPVLLVTVPVLLVGLGLYARALWRLAPAAASHEPAGTPADPPSNGGGRPGQAAEADHLVSGHQPGSPQPSSAGTTGVCAGRPGRGGAPVRAAQLGRAGLQAGQG